MFGKKLVKCKKCKCLMEKKDAQVVKIDGQGVYYCESHRPKWDELKHTYDFYFSSVSYRFYKKMEVDEQGEPIGYVKKEQNKCEEELLGTPLKGKNKCAICKNEIEGRKKRYCSNVCRKIGYRSLARKYYYRNKKK